MTVEGKDSDAELDPRGRRGDVRERLQTGGGRLVVRPQRVVSEMLAAGGQITGESRVEAGGDAQSPAIGVEVSWPSPAPSRGLASRQVDGDGALGPQRDALGVQRHMFLLAADPEPLQHSATAMTASSIAKCEPMQARGPPPNGK